VVANGGVKGKWRGGVEVQNLEMDGAMEWMMRGMVAHGEYMLAAVLVDDIIND
jgi:hypothetical protein